MKEKGMRTSEARKRQERGMVVRLIPGNVVYLNVNPMGIDEVGEMRRKKAEKQRRHQENLNRLVGRFHGTVWQNGVPRINK